MELISLIILILLSLVGYSVGAVSKGGKITELKPQIIDLILIFFIWAAEIYSRITFDLTGWPIILAWVIFCILIGMLAIWPRKFPEETVSREKGLIKNRPREASKNVLKKLLAKWQEFFNRVGSFQSRIILSIFFLVLAWPIALGVKMFSDPLRMKYKSKESYWLPKTETKSDIEQFRRQF